LAFLSHENPRATKLYDRTGDEITLDEIAPRSAARVTAKL
jgi:hypothetical protein